jgi:hypothetical protein
LSGTNTFSGGLIVTSGKLIALSSFAIPDGTNLTIGANAQAIFGAPVVGAPAVSGDLAPKAVPEPGTLALLATVFAAAAWRFRPKR